MIDIIRFNGEHFDLGYTRVIHASQLHVRTGGTSDENKRILSDSSVDILINAEYHKARDTLHYRNNGLTPAHLALAKKNKTAIGFSTSDLLRLTSAERVIILGRMIHNVTLCRKYKIPMVLASFAKTKWDMRNPRDLISFGTLLGMTPAEAQNALTFRKKEKDIRVIHSPKEI